MGRGIVSSAVTGVVCSCFSRPSFTARFSAYTGRASHTTRGFQTEMKFESWSILV